MRLFLPVNGHALAATSRKPPAKALALSPARHSGGSASSRCTLPPPSTTSSGSSAATSRATTSLTCLRHLSVPSRCSACTPTWSSNVLCL